MSLNNSYTHTAWKVNMDGEFDNEWLIIFLKYDELFFLNVDSYTEDVAVIFSSQAEKSINLVLNL